MDYGKVLGRAWQITWRWKILWVLGFLAALSGRTPSSSINYTFSGDDVDLSRYGIHLTPDEFLASILGLVCAILCVVIIIAIILWVVSVIARGGLIAGVQQVEVEGNTSFSKAWRAGARKFWTLFGLGVLAALPIIGLMIIAGIIIGVGITLGVNILDQSEIAGIMSIIWFAVVCGGFFCCGLVLLGIVLEQIRIYAERAAILEDLGWIDAFKRGWQVLKENLGPTIILWLIFLALAILVFIVTLPIIFALMIPFFAIIGIGDADYSLVWLVCCGGILMMIIFAVFNAIVMTFSSATWTLAYRELTGIAGQPPALEEIPSPHGEPEPPPIESAPDSQAEAE